MAYTRSITVTARGTRDDDNYGSWIPGPQTTYDGVLITPTRSTEPGGELTEQASTDLTIYGLPLSASVTTDARVHILDGPYANTDWVVVGEPARWESPFSGAPEGTVLTVNRSGGRDG